MRGPREEEAVPCCPTTACGYLAVGERRKKDAMDASLVAVVDYVMQDRRSGKGIRRGRWMALPGS